MYLEPLLVWNFAYCNFDFDDCVLLFGRLLVGNHHRDAADLRLFVFFGDGLEGDSDFSFI